MNVVSLRVHSILYLPSILTSELWAQAFFCLGSDRSEKSISSASNTSLFPFIGYGGLPKFCHPLHPSQCSTKPEIRVESFSHFLAESFSHFLVESFSHFSRPGETLTRVTGVTKFWQSSVANQGNKGRIGGGTDTFFGWWKMPILTVEKQEKLTGS